MQELNHFINPFYKTRDSYFEIKMFHYFTPYCILMYWEIEHMNYIFKKNLFTRVLMNLFKATALKIAQWTKIAGPGELRLTWYCFAFWTRNACWELVWYDIPSNACQLLSVCHQFFNIWIAVFFLELRSSLFLFWFDQMK